MAKKRLSEMDFDNLIEWKTVLYLTKFTYEAFEASLSAPVLLPGTFSATK